VLAIAAEAREEGGLVYVLLATSNPGASQFQSLELADGQTVRERVADAILDWHRATGACGAVAGATHPEELSASLAKLALAEVPVLIPGIGHQGGTVADVKRCIHDAGYPLPLARVNVSSAITHPWRSEGAPRNWRDVVSQALDGFWSGLQ
jgi:orotidine-5'-phosphate decarboxylase